MSKLEFLDILRDYLKSNFSVSEIVDILTEYEQFFINEQLQGKSEEEICRLLGSPKRVAKQLIKEIRDDTEEEKKYFIKEQLVFLKNKNEHKAKEMKLRKILKFEERINRLISNKSAKLIIYVFTIILTFLGIIILPIFSVIGIILTIGVLINFLSYIFGIILYSINGYIATSCIFGSIFLTGLIILGWTIYIIIIKFIKEFIENYKFWMQRKLVYLKKGNSGKTYNSKVQFGFNKDKSGGVEEIRKEGDKNE